jgi:hypothetical protein
MLRSVARQGLLIVGVVFVAGVVLQVVLAGLGVFSDPRSFLTHRDFGYLLGMFTLVLLVLALVGRAPRRVIGMCALLLVLFAMQSVFIALRSSAPEVAALHPLNGFLILLVAITVTRAAWALRGDAAVGDPAPGPLTASSGTR